MSASTPSPGRPSARARLIAGLSLLALLATIVVLVVYVARHLGYVLAGLATLGLAVSSLWAAVTHRRWWWIGALAALAFLAGAAATLVAADAGVAVTVGVVLGTAAAGALGSAALHDEVRDAVGRRWRPVAAARRPVLLMNPKSGGGKVQRFHLVDEAAGRGIGVVVLEPGDELRAMAEAAAARGADVLGMAGGDGSQAVVASVAAAHGVAYVCIPAGTRNHLALDLGVDRDDVVGALDAFGPARQATIDLGEVNGRVFVNNVSLGLYATMVASDAYRDEKVQTAIRTLQDRLGPAAAPFDLHLDGPDGRIDAPNLVEVSNNPYVRTLLNGFGTRARLDTGRLGVIAARVEGPADARRVVAGRRRGGGVHSWSTPTLEVDSGGPVAAGIDGESATLDPPLRFASRPGALHVRVAHAHPGASPAVARAPLGSSTVVGLLRLVRGRPSGLVD